MIHLERAKVTPNLTELVEDFFSARLLLWMEVMNLRKYMDVGVGVIRQAEEWCIVSEPGSTQDSIMPDMCIAPVLL